MLLKSFLIIITIILIAHALIYIAFGIALIPFPFDYDQAEGFELNNAILLSRGQCPYCNNDIYPFYGSGYPPFFHVIMIPFVWVFGPAYWYGRLIIFVATLLTAAIIMRAVHQSAQHRWIAFLAGSAFLASNYIYHIGPLLRQHLLMVFFETLAVFVASQLFEANHRKPSRLIWVIVLLLCAGYTKQLAISTCLAIFLWMLLRNPRTAVFFGFALGCLAGAIFLVWMVITEGQWWVNIISSNQNPYITEQFVGLARQFLYLHWPLLLLSLGVVVYELYFSRLSVYSVWFIVSLISTLGAGKWGAGDSYFATTIVAMCILSGIAISKTVQGAWHVPPNYLSSAFTKLKWIPRQPNLLLSLIALGMFLFYALRVFKFPTSGPLFSDLARVLSIEPAPGHRYPLYDSAGWTVGYAVTGHFPSPNDYTNGQKILEEVRRTDGLVMSEDAGFMILDHRDVITNAVQLNNLWQNGLYDPSQLIAMIARKDFGLIILRAGFFPQPVLSAIQTHYFLDDTIPMNGFDYQLWRPL